MPPPSGDEIYKPSGPQQEIDIEEFLQYLLIYWAWAVIKNARISEKEGAVGGVVGQLLLTLWRDRAELLSGNYYDAKKTCLTIPLTEFSNRHGSHFPSDPEVGFNDLRRPKPGYRYLTQLPSKSDFLAWSKLGFGNKRTVGSLFKPVWHTAVFQEGYFDGTGIEVTTEVRYLGAVLHATNHTHFRIGLRDDAQSLAFLRKSAHTTAATKATEDFFSRQARYAWLSGEELSLRSIRGVPVLRPADRPDVGTGGHAEEAGPQRPSPLELNENGHAEEEHAETVAQGSSTNLSLIWAKEQVERAVFRAGPRYTPELHRDTALTECLNAFALADSWWETVQDYERAGDELKAHGERLSYDFPIPSAIIPQWLHAMHAGGVFARELRKGRTAEPPRLNKEALSTHINGRIHDVTVCCETLHQALSPEELTHPDNGNDNAHRSEGMQELLNALGDYRRWIESPAFTAATAGLLLITGEAGSGKTHALCDSMTKRAQEGLPGSLLYADQFGADLSWERIRIILALDHSFTRDKILNAWNALGKEAGKPFVFAIDAINEATQQIAWQGFLTELVADVQRYPWIRFAISCRTHYEHRCIPQNVFPTYQHQGFRGQEYGAAAAFFAHHGLPPPEQHQMDPSFGNPLVLKLVCKLLQRTGEKLSGGWLSSKDILRALLRETSRTFAQRYGDDERAHRLTTAVTDLVSDALRTGRSVWPYAEAEAILNHRLPRHLIHASVLGILLEEELLTAIPAGSGEDDSVVRFSYERFGDVLLAEQLVLEAETMAGTDPLASLRTRLAGLQEGAAPRLLEVLNVIVPERWASELLIRPAPNDSLTTAWLASLPWRSDTTFSPRTWELLHECLSVPALLGATLDGLLTVGLRSASVALMVHEWLVSLPMAERDVLWNKYLDQSYEDGTLLVWSLVARAATGNAVVGQRESVIPSLTVLSWAFASTNGDLRERVLRAAVGLSAHQPEAWGVVLPRFLTVDDDAVLGGVVAAIYGCFLRDSRAAVGPVARIIVGEFFGCPELARFRNVRLRDEARAIVELASHREQLPKQVRLRVARPAYPLCPRPVPQPLPPVFVPSDDTPETYVFRYRDFPKELFGDDWGAESWQRGLSAVEAWSWVGNEVLRLGWSVERGGTYDADIWTTTGSKERKVARTLAAKYVYIAFHRLLGLLHDTTTPSKVRVAQVLPLQAPALRDGDPSRLLVPPDPARSLAWWEPVTYAIGRVNGFSVEEADRWLRAKDNPCGSTVTSDLRDPQGKAWCLLGLDRTWQPAATRRFEFSRYRAELSLDSYLLPLKHVDAFRESLQSQGSVRSREDPDVFWGQLPRGTIAERAYLGEYPNQAGMVGYHLEREGDADDSVFAQLVPVQARLWTRDPRRTYMFGPSPLWFENGGIRWDGAAGYVTDDGVVRFLDASWLQSGPNVLLADTQYLLEQCRQREVAVVRVSDFEKEVRGDFFDHRGKKRARLKHQRVNFLMVTLLDPAGTPTTLLQQTYHS